ncbi:MAG: hypothetical protein ACI9R3_005931 [Verrucomicrobiales bacterium]|jgi:hypothetical protein
MVNASFDRKRDKRMALQHRAMMEANVYVREFLYHDFARKLTQLGYKLERPHIYAASFALGYSG